MNHSGKFLKNTVRNINKSQLGTRYVTNTADAARHVTNMADAARYVTIMADAAILHKNFSHISYKTEEKTPTVKKVCSDPWRSQKGQLWQHVRQQGLERLRQQGLHAHSSGASLTKLGWEVTFS